jgi:PKD repeat protein/PhoPQ-activated pathogenicity-related protein
MLRPRRFLGQAILIVGLCAILTGCPTPRTNNGAQVALLVSPETLDFGTDPADGSTLTFTVRQSLAPPQLPGFTATVAARDQGWLRVFTVPDTTPPTGRSTGPNDPFTFHVELMRQGLSAGTNTGTVTISAPGVVPRTVTVTATALVAADFAVEPREPFKGEAVTFLDRSTVMSGQAPVTAWEWDFGDGETSTEQNPQHVYAAAGEYTVRLRVFSGNLEDVEEKVNVVSVKETTLPVADFSVSNQTPDANTAVQFTDKSVPGTANITAWAWDFGDGETSTEQNPSHIYKMGGTFDVSLTVTTAHGTDTETKVAYMEVVARPPTADFSASSTDIIFGNSITFTDLSTAGTAPITGWLWNFGDGQTSTEQNPVYTYQQGGTFTVSLTVFSDHGDTTATKVNYILVRTIKPDAGFTAAPREEFVGRPIQFTDTSTPGTAEITQWLWNFGDGQTSTEQNPMHTYAEAGTYPVSLTVTSAHGTDTETVPGYVVIKPRTPPVANFSATPTNPYATDEVQFTDLSEPGSSDITDWLWTFGDGSTSTEQNPRHAYAQTGVYPVSLTVTTADGEDTKLVAQFINVQPTVDPVADFTADPAPAEVGETIQFTDASDPGSSSITAWSWDFGDGETSDEQNPTHEYELAGMYTVTLTVTTNHGEHTETKTDFIMVRPTVAFSATPLEAAVGEFVSFTDETPAGKVPVATWLWEFGDGLISAEQNPQHSYGGQGAYSVTLTVTLQDGATGSLTQTEYITAEVKGAVANFIASNYNPAIYEPVNFTDLSNPGSAAITRWQWDFGDGTTSAAQHPSHTYTSEGEYTVTLTVTTPFGTSEPVSRIVLAQGPHPTANFKQDRSEVLRGLQPVRFTTQATIEGKGYISAYEWFVWRAAEEFKEGEDFFDTHYRRPASGKEYVTLPMDHFLLNPFHEAGRYNVTHRVWATTLANPGNPDDPNNQWAFFSHSVTKEFAVLVREPSYIDRYVYMADPLFHYSLQGAPVQGDGYKTFNFDLASLHWRAPGATDPVLWQHRLAVVQPASITNNTALLYLDGGEGEPGAPGDVDPNLAEFAKQTGSVVAVLDRIPNQPLESSLGPLSEDRLMAASMDAFLQATGTADSVYLPEFASQLLTFPMTKAAVRAMDVVQKFMGDPVQSGRFPPKLVDHFVLAGGSPEGWTRGIATWMAAAHDTRVKGVVPMNYSGMAMPDQFDHQEEHFGQLLDTMEPYNEFGIPAVMASHPELDMSTPLYLKELRMRIERDIREILEDLEDNNWIDRVEGNELDFAAEIKDKLFLENQDYWNILSHLSFRAGFTPECAEAYRYAQALFNALDLVVTNFDTEEFEVGYARRVAGPNWPIYSYTLLPVDHPRYANEDPESPLPDPLADPDVPDGFRVSEGYAGYLVHLMKRAEESLLIGPFREGFMTFLSDPMSFHSPYTAALNMPISSEYGNRLNFPKYMLLSPGDSFTTVDSTRVYFGRLAQAKSFRLYPNSERTFADIGGYPMALLDTLGWYDNVIAGQAQPFFTWQFNAANQLVVRVDPANPPVELKLWQAIGTDLDFRKLSPDDANTPVWNSVPLSTDANGTAFVQIFENLTNYTVYFVEAKFETGNGREYVVTTDVGIVSPYQSPYGKAAVDDAADAEATPAP